MPTGSSHPLSHTTRPSLTPHQLVGPPVLDTTPTFPVMPGFYSRHTGNHLPLTPPDSGSGYGYASMHYSADPYPSQQPMAPPRHDNAYEYQQSYMQPPTVAPASSTYVYPQNAYQHPTSLPPISTYYEPMGAPILPPLRIPDGAAFTQDYQRRLQREQEYTAREQERPVAAKEEKVTGGVSAKLDYDMERMTDFVTEATQTMYAYHNSPICLADIDVTRSFQHSTQSPPSFRKWVLQVLSATRLPSATILLGLHYLNDRMAHFPASVVPGENQIYRLLAVCLILGSKFLDDNTFINRSWSDVTAIKVVELNALEIEWLHLINYNLHVDPHANSGLRAWLAAWKDYDAKALAKQNHARLSPLDTNVHRLSVRERCSPYPAPHSAPHTAPSRRTYDDHQSSRFTYSASAYSVGDAWSQTERPALPQLRSPLDQFEDASRRATEERARQCEYYGAASAYYNQPSSYPHAWTPQIWHDMNQYDPYRQHYRPYPMASNYAAQTVMG